jgi:hypothetical protein
MRYLNKIIFINSATIKYAEIIVGGNVHFIGTQGVGKSTVLRSILFFYNADTQKLGIKSGQKTFYEYYFPSADSYIIYEVAKETGTFSVLCYKQSGKICYRFFDSEYKKELFISEQNKAYESWEKIKEQFNKHQIASSNKIDRYEDYRDILYGNNDGKKEYRKYALLESKQYQNIPRTIQNVLLNAELKAEFIKQTIIKSLSDDDIEIDLKIYTHELNTFDIQLNDIKKWTDKNKNGEIVVKKQAEQIAKLHTNLNFLENEKNQLVKQLAWIIQHVKNQLPKLEDKVEIQESKKDVLVKKIEELNDVFQKKREKLLGDIKVLKSDLDKAKKKEDEYNKQNINDIIQRVAKKQFLVSNQENLLNEKQILSTQFTELTQRFDAMLSEIENQKQRFLNIKKEERNELQANFLQFQNDANTQYNKHIREIREEHKERLETSKLFLDENRNQQSILNNKKAEIKHKRYFETEIEIKKSEINDIKNAKQHSENQIIHFQSQIKTIQTQFDTEEKSKNETTERQIEKLQEQIVQLQQEIDAIDFKINNSKDSLYGWLNDNNKGWENNIGKIIKDDETVLFNSALQPKLIDKTSTIFGVEINLSEINKSIKTVADYKKEKNNLAQKIDLLKSNITDQTETLSSEIEKLKNKYQPKIKEYKKEIDLHHYNVEQNKSKLEQAQLALSDYERSAILEKQQDLQKAEQEIGLAIDAEFKAKESLQKIEQEIIKLEKEREKEKDKKVNEEKNRIDNLIKDIESDIKKSTEEFDNKIKTISDNKSKELTNKGADTKRLNEIESEITTIKNELKFIDNHIALVERYKYDKIELLDKMQEFKNQKDILEKNLTNDEDKHQHQKSKLNIELNDLQELISSLKTKINSFKSDLLEFDSFNKTEIYLSIPDKFKEAKDENKSDKNCRSLIREINQTVYSLIDKQNKLKEEITQFTGNFSADNIFKFKTNFTRTDEYLQFADELNEFIEENKIERFEKDVNERFAYIVLSIGKETENLMSKSGEIQKTITKINNDFIAKGSFVTAIKKIELRWVESSNKIVAYLLNIQQFKNENPFLGGNNLFASQDSDKKNKQAIELLKGLSRAIVESKKDKINLSDSFELQFRIVENQNDTGWVEKIANVGSEGTDILVKAMINIMLLNVSKGESSKSFKDFKLHCMMDEIGKLHSNNVKGILQFANERNILLINGSPEESNALSYKHIYQLYKDEKSFTKVKRLISNFN